MSTVSVEPRQGSLLFILGGTWPAMPSTIPADLHLVANSVSIVLRPHAHPDGFAVVSAQNGGSELPVSALALALRPGQLLIDVSARYVSAPLTFSVALVRGSSVAGSVPDHGSLTWSGSGAPKVLPTPPAVPPAPLSPMFDPTILTGRCVAIPAGTVTPDLQLGSPTMGTGTDPRTHLASPYVSVAWGAGFGSRYRQGAAFTVTAILASPGLGVPSGSRAVDRLGQTQLSITWDGKSDHKSVRVWSGRSWSARSDDAASDLTVAIKDNGVVYYWPGIRTGDQVGFVAATDQGCAGIGLSGAR